MMIIDTRSCTQGKLSVHPDSPTHSDYNLAMIKIKMLIIMKIMLLVDVKVTFIRRNVRRVKKVGKLLKIESPVKVDVALFH